MSMNEIRAMREKRVKLWEAAKAFVESRKDVSGTLSAEDSATYDQMIAPDAQLHGVLGEPEVRQHDVLLFIIPWREHQHHGRQVAGAGKVKSGIAGAAFQFILIDSAAAFIPSWR